MRSDVNLTWQVVAAMLVGAGGLALLFVEQGAPGSLLPHGYCFTWNPALLWTHVTSDALIGAAYVTIPVTLLHLVRKRGDMPFNGVVVLFAVFIISCGATHWIEVWTVWHPDYWLSGNVKLITAVASVLTAAVLVRLVPSILAIPTVAQLTAAKQALEQEVGSRRRAEEALLQERSELERRVLERTRELAAASAVAERAHAEAEEANKLKDRFLAKVSHELRTPLQSTMSWAQLLRLSAHDPQRATDAADRIIHNVRSQARLIDDLLDISRILSGKLHLEWQPVDADQVVRKAADVVRAASTASKVSIDVIGPGEPLPMRADPLRLEQVSWNLINNAVQASEPGGRVEVRVRVHDGSLVVEVQDWGTGIDAQELAHVFEPFRQSARGGRSHRGLGLGLAITHSITDLFGGELHAHSEGLGLGATFTLRLPLGATDSALQASAPTGLTTQEMQALAGLRLIYVEDEPDIADSGRAMLASLGIDVEVYLSFESAATRLAHGGFDVLLSDLNLGGGRSALDLLALLRTLPHGATMPAIVLSAYGSAEDRRVSHAAGFADHLVKPADVASVARALLKVLEPRPAA